MFRFNIFLYLIIILVTSCAQKEEAEVRYSACTDESLMSGLCIRYMDREIYYARNLFETPEDNNEFDVVKAIDSFREVAKETGLGENYFSFKVTEPTELELILEEKLYAGESGKKFKSFFLILEDTKFNELYSEIGSSDPNVIIKVNMANKKQFFMIFRSSCFITNDPRCTNSLASSFTPNLGLNALIGRSLARLIGVKTKDCIDYPIHTMCAITPNDDQWSLVERTRFYDLFNNQLETIRNNKNYYDVYFPEE